MARITLQDLFACTTNGGHFVAEAADGRLVHISEVPSGLRCACRCPGCERPMVAKKGPIQLTHHFAHKPDSQGHTCTTAGETALHKFAKAVLNERLELLLPEKKVGDGVDSLTVVRKGSLSFERAVLEKKEDEIVPDVVCIIRDRHLIVEFKVTHPCDDEKIARIKKMDIGAIEVDLEPYRHQPLDSVGDAILFEAKRKWLHNPREREGLARLEELRLERRRTLEAKAAPLRREYVAACVEVLELRDPSAAAGMIAGDGLAEAIGIKVPGLGCFTVPPRDWQAAVLMEAVDFGVKGGRPFLTASRSLQKIRCLGWIRRSFENIAEPEVEVIQSDGTEFATPLEAVEAWLKALSRMGLVRSTNRDGQWVLGHDVIRKIANARELRALPGRRLDEIREIVEDLLSGVPGYETKSFSFEGWAKAHSIPQAMNSEEGFAHIRRELSDLRYAIRSKPQEDMHLMGLPLRGVLWRRLEEKRREKEDQERKRKAREQEEEDQRVERLLAYARVNLETEGNEWVIIRNADLGGKSPLEAVREGAPGLKSAMRLIDTILDQRRRDEQAMNAAMMARLGLEAAAATVFRGDHLKAYLKGPHPKLGGKSPQDFCIDKASMDRCVALTLNVGKKRG